ncbi:hypothetical protein Cadr_000003245 [Camelus dromedarius]|uniref:Uncharacterized protein n=1 Tax=Camelus dromedarius TaxID=9838 RepID=A0A5N4C255_CAMDR|nr:hypothetical protein Cadr_000003245 [Camelus dromedarius]
MCVGEGGPRARPHREASPEAAVGNRPNTGLRPPGKMPETKQRMIMAHQETPSSGLQLLLLLQNLNLECWATENHVCSGPNSSLWGCLPVWPSPRPSLTCTHAPRPALLTFKLGLCGLLVLHLTHSEEGTVLQVGAGTLVRGLGDVWAGGLPCSPIGRGSGDTSMSRSTRSLCNLQTPKSLQVHIPSASALGVWITIRTISHPRDHPDTQTQMRHSAQGSGHQGGNCICLQLGPPRPSPWGLESGIPNPYHGVSGERVNSRGEPAVKGIQAERGTTSGCWRVKLGCRGHKLGPSRMEYVAGTSVCGEGAPSSGSGWEDSIGKGEASKGSGPGAVARPRVVLILSTRTPLMAVWGLWGWRSGEWRAGGRVVSQLTVPPQGLTQVLLAPGATSGTAGAPAKSPRCRRDGVGEGAHAQTHRRADSGTRAERVAASMHALPHPVPPASGTFGWGYCYTGSGAWGQEDLGQALRWDVSHQTPKMGLLLLTLSGPPHPSTGSVPSEQPVTSQPVSPSPRGFGIPDSSPHGDCHQRGFQPMSEATGRGGPNWRQIQFPPWCPEPCTLVRVISGCPQLACGPGVVDGQKHWECRPAGIGEESSPGRGALGVRGEPAVKGVQAERGTTSGCWRWGVGAIREGAPSSGSGERLGLKGSGAGGVARPRAVVALSARTPLVAVWGHWGWRSGEWRAAARRRVGLQKGGVPAHGPTQVLLAPGAASGTAGAPAESPRCRWDGEGRACANAQTRGQRNPRRARVFLEQLPEKERGLESGPTLTVSSAAAAWEVKGRWMGHGAGDWGGAWVGDPEEVLRPPPGSWCCPVSLVFPEPFVCPDSYSRVWESGCGPGTSPTGPQTMACSLDGRRLRGGVPVLRGSRWTCSHLLQGLFSGRPLLPRVRRHIFMPAGSWEEGAVLSRAASTAGKDLVTLLSSLASSGGGRGPLRDVGGPVVRHERRRSPIFGVWWETGPVQDGRIVSGRERLARGGCLVESRATGPIRTLRRWCCPLSLVVPEPRICPDSYSRVWESGCGPGTSPTGPRTVACSLEAGAVQSVGGG